MSDPVTEFKEEFKISIKRQRNIEILKPNSSKEANSGRSRAANINAP
jgi:hypothetical protein